MYAKNFLEDICYTDTATNDYKVIIDTFILAEKKYNVKELTLTYFLISTGLSKNKLYDVFHILIEEKIIYKLDYVQCSQCLYEEQTNGLYMKHRCSRCNQELSTDLIVEKFSLKEEFKNE